MAMKLMAVAEDQWFERKSVRIEPRPLAEALVGFANADGRLTFAQRRELIYDIGQAV